MSVAFTVAVPPDAIEAVTGPIRRRVAPGQVLPVIGRAGQQCVRDHLFALDAARPNALGGKRTHFYGQAARGANYRVTGDGVVVSISQVGIGQRLRGGTIRPQAAKYLTIPARAEAYGRRAREFNDLVVLFGRGGRPIGLVQAQQTRVRVTKKGVTRGRQVGGGVFFWFVKEVNQAPDPTVLPTPSEIGDAVAIGLRNLFRN